MHYRHGRKMVGGKGGGGGNTGDVTVQHNRCPVPRPLCDLSMSVELVSGGRGGGGTGMQSKERDLSSGPKGG